MDNMMWNLLNTDEDAFLRRADAGQLRLASARFRQMAREAETPQTRDFYADRAYDFALRAAGR